MLQEKTFLYESYYRSVVSISNRRGGNIIIRENTKMIEFRFHNFYVFERRKFFYLCQNSGGDEPDLITFGYADKGA